jgi:hypothetical protein
MIGANMFDPSSPAPIWVIWPYLSWSERLFFLALCTLGVYSLLLAVTVVRFQRTAGDLNRIASVQKNLLRISKHVRNLQQATLCSFYLFGFVLFAGFQSAYRVLENSSTPLGLIVVRNFQIHFVFAANAFLVFLVFHFIQWFAAKRVSAMGLQSNS